MFLLYQIKNVKVYDESQIQLLFWYYSFKILK